MDTFAELPPRRFVDSAARKNLREPESIRHVLGLPTVALQLLHPGLSDQRSAEQREDRVRLSAAAETELAANVSVGTDKEQRILRRMSRKGQRVLQAAVRALLLPRNRQAEETLRAARVEHAVRFRSHGLRDIHQATAEFDQRRKSVIRHAALPYRRV